MVTPALEAHFENLGTDDSTDVGAQMFVDELLGSASDQIEIVVGGNPHQVGLSGHADDAGTLGWTWRLTARVTPYLADHAIGEVPVLPVVLVLDWFTRAAKALRPEVEVESCRALKVLRGVRLNHFDSMGDRFQIVMTERPGQEDQVVDFALKGFDGTLHYTAEVRFQAEHQLHSRSKSLPSSCSLGRAPSTGMSSSTAQSFR